MRSEYLVVCTIDNWQSKWYHKFKGVKVPRKGNVYIVEYTCIVDHVLYLGLKEMLQPTYFRNKIPFIGNKLANEVWEAKYFEIIQFNQCAIEELLKEPAKI